MKLSIMTMITKPDERMDKWREAIENYVGIADEVVVVVGDVKTFNEFDDTEKVKYFLLEWNEDWHYTELPKHLNFGLKQCTGDWVLKLDIDQMLDSDNAKLLRPAIDNAIQQGIKSIALEKLHFVASMKYRLKGKQIICFERNDTIKFGKTLDLKAYDMCQPVEVDYCEEINGYEVPVGHFPETVNTSVCYWNYNFTFKTEEVAKEHFWRWARAWDRCFKDARFGGTKEASWDFFKDMMITQWKQTTHMSKLEEHPTQIQRCLFDLKKEQLGYRLWSLTEK